MKIRTDFVSNSSSCSFIINNNFQKFSKIMKLFSDVEIPYNFEDDVSVQLYVKNKNYFYIREELIKLGYCSSGDFWFYDDAIIQKNIKEHPDEVSNVGFYLNFSDLIELGDLYKYIDYIYFSSNDYGSGLLHLKILYDFYKLNECKPDITDSNHKLLNSEDDKSFYTIITKKYNI